MHLKLFFPYKLTLYPIQKYKLSLNPKNIQYEISHERLMKLTIPNQAIGKLITREPKPKDP